jgi:uncharacterized protein (TIGR02611 family)
MKWLIHHTKRALRIASGTVLLVVGLIFMIPGIPGPGFPLVIVGLGILAVDFVWAHRLKTHLKDQADKVVAKIKGHSRKGTPAGKT